MLVSTGAAAVNQDHILRLDRTRCVPQGGAAFSCCRSPIPSPPQERAIRSRSRVRIYAAALRSGLGCALSCRIFRTKRKAVFFQRIAQRHNIDAGTAFFFRGRGSIIERLFGWQSVFFLKTDWFVSYADNDHADIYVFFTY